MRYFDGATIRNIRKGHYSAIYFNRTRDILLQEKKRSRATMQVFQKNEGSILCGVPQVRELFKAGTGYWKGKTWISTWSEISLKSLPEGERLSAGEPVMHISGPYAYFAHVESLYLGILARATLVATNVRRFVEAARGKPVLFFADRFDNFTNQELDGYAAHVGGAAGVCTQAHASWWGGKPQGTIPHALIALSHGSTVEAVGKFSRRFSRVKTVALVDFDNDSVRTSLEVVKKFKNRLWGVRLDTASDMLDVSLSGYSHRDNYGVSSRLVRAVRRALDRVGAKKVKIVVSGGFTAEKIRLFEKHNVPVDIYGVGSALLKGNNDFTADIVLVDGKKIAKAGRRYQENPRLIKMNN